MSAVQEQRKTSHQKISVSCLCLSPYVIDFVLTTSTIQHVVLVGGFAASDWLFNSVYTPLQKLGLNVVRPENHV